MVTPLQQTNNSQKWLNSVSKKTIVERTKKKRKLEGSFDGIPSVTLQKQCKRPHQPIPGENADANDF